MFCDRTPSLYIKCKLGSDVGEASLTRDRNFR